MKVNFPMKRILPLCIGAIFVGIYFFIGVEKQMPSLHYQPTNCDFSIRINVPTITDKLVEDVLFAKKDAELEQLMNAFTKKKRSQSSFPVVGIDFFSEIVYFQKRIDGEIMHGFLVNLSDPELFKRPNTGAKNSIFWSKKDHVGLILYTSKPELEKELEAFATHFWTSAHRKSSFHYSDDQLIALQLTQNQHRNKMDLALKIHQNKLEILGNMRSFTQPSSSWSLKSDGFHAVIGQFPSEVQQKIVTRIEEEGFQLPKLESFSINYRGTSIGENSILPEGEMVLHFEDTLNRQFLINQLDNWKKLGFEVESQTTNSILFSREDKSYTFRILDTKTLFFGVKSENLMAKPEKYLYLMEGDLTDLTAINSGGLMAVGLNFYPPYKASKKLFQSVEFAKVSVKSNPQNSKVITEISLKENRMIITEALRFILTIFE